jgi:hypothetical protein
VLQQFADWLSLTWLSVAIQTHNEWVIPTIQSIHIVGIGIVVASVFMIDLRVLGLAGIDQTLQQTTKRFGPWLSASLIVLLITGGLLVVGEPARELLTFSFWFKMALIVIGTAIAVLFQMALKRNEQHWEQSVHKSTGIKVLAVLTLVIWLTIIVLGRLIAYDHIWGSWSLVPQG